MDHQRQIDRLNIAIEAQKLFIHTVPDPDNRERAEANLMTLVLLRDEHDEARDMLASILVK